MGGVRLFLSHFAVSLRFLPRPSCHLSVVPLSSFVLSLVASSSVASLSSASFCAAAACRSLVLSASFAFRRSSTLLAAYPGPSSLSSRKDESSDAHCDHLPPSHVVAQVHSLFEHLCLHG